MLRLVYLSVYHLCTFPGPVNNLGCNYRKKKLRPRQIENIHAPTHTLTHLTAWWGSRREPGVVGEETVGFNDTLSLRTLFPYCNYALADMDLSLTLIVCPDAHLLSQRSVWVSGTEGGGWMFGSPRAGQVAFRSPWEAQTGAIGQIGIVLMAPQAPRYIAAKP